jgi:hypothetical protein
MFDTDRCIVCGFEGADLNSINDKLFCDGCCAVAEHILFASSFAVADAAVATGSASKLVMAARVPNVIVLVAEFSTPDEVGMLRAICTQHLQSLDTEIMRRSIHVWLLLHMFTGSIFSSRDCSLRVRRLLDGHALHERRDHYEAWFWMQVRFKLWLTDAISRKLGSGSYVDYALPRPTVRDVVLVCVQELLPLLCPHWRQLREDYLFDFLKVEHSKQMQQCPRVEDIDDLVRRAHDDDINDSMGGPALCIANFILCLLDLESAHAWRTLLLPFLR